MIKTSYFFLFLITFSLEAAALPRFVAKRGATCLVMAQFKGCWDTNPANDPAVPGQVCYKDDKTGKILVAKDKCDSASSLVTQYECAELTDESGKKIKHIGPVPPQGCKFGCDEKTGACEKAVCTDYDEKAMNPLLVASYGEVTSKLKPPEKHGDFCPPGLSTFIGEQVCNKDHTDLIPIGLISGIPCPEGHICDPDISNNNYARCVKPPAPWCTDLNPSDPSKPMDSSNNAGIQFSFDNTPPTTAPNVCLKDFSIPLPGLDPALAAQPEKILLDMTCQDLNKDGKGDIPGMPTPFVCAGTCLPGQGKCSDEATVDECKVMSDPATVDPDQDGVGDVCDNCPTATNADQADSDGDKVGNACDLCPNDATKTTSAGVCGCSQSDVDTDQDGQPDCQDECPNDPKKVAVGICGCGVADVDSDQDGKFNCQDNCPEVSNPDQKDSNTDQVGDACGPCAQPCNDNNACTMDSCDETKGCHHDPVGDGTLCSDFDACNGSETCQQGVCVAGTFPDCDDGNACTNNTCSPIAGCTSTAIGTGTSNGCGGCEALTQEPGMSCLAGAGTCAGQGSYQCDPNDKNKTVCSAQPKSDGTPCSDKICIMGGETCQAGVCQGGTAVSCDDGDVCTNDSCDSTTGCQNLPIPGCQDTDKDGVPDEKDNCPVMDNPAAKCAWETVSMGYSHSCALSSNGKLSCWGKSSYGGANPPDGEFLDVKSGTSATCGLLKNGKIVCWGIHGWGQYIVPNGTFTQVEKGFSHSCGMLTDGKVKCWGASQQGELAVPNVTFKKFSVSYHNNCGLLENGQAICWGHEPWEGTLSPPKKIFTDIAVGRSFACGHLSDGHIECWGDNQYNQLDVPNKVFIQFSVGAYHACALLTNGQVQCWGSKKDGKTLPPAKTFQKVFAGSSHSCGILASGDLECWGKNDSEFSLKNPPSLSSMCDGSQSDQDGDGLGDACDPCPAGCDDQDPCTADGCDPANGCQHTKLTMPECLDSDGDNVPDDKDNCPKIKNGSESCSVWQRLAVGDHHSCGLLNSGEVKCWGENTQGVYTPPDVVMTQLSAGASGRTCGLLPNGKAITWGGGDAWPNTGTYYDGPFKQVSINEANGCGLKTNGTVDCWGFSSGVSSPPSDEIFEQISLGADHGCGLKTGGAVDCWGSNTVDQLTPPVGVTFKSISAGGYHTCGLTSGGETKCWGSDNWGQLSVPSENFTQLSGGRWHHCGLVGASGEVKCWGSDGWGQASPPDEKFVEVQAGGFHSCGLLESGEIECWGAKGFEFGATESPQLCPAADPQVDQDGDSVGDVCDN